MTTFYASLHKYALLFATIGDSKGVSAVLKVRKRKIGPPVRFMHKYVL